MRADPTRWVDRGSRATTYEGGSAISRATSGGTAQPTHPTAAPEPPTARPWNATEPQRGYRGHNRRWVTTPAAGWAAAAGAAPRVRPTTRTGPAGGSGCCPTRRRATCGSGYGWSATTPSSSSPVARPTVATVPSCSCATSARCGGRVVTAAGARLVALRRSRVARGGPVTRQAPELRRSAQAGLAEAVTRRRPSRPDNARGPYGRAGPGR